ncbi:MAG: class I SAM-dependent methyltransferase [Thaumarchaeota archaeon]|nr:class I SAM-dependent methyltransferase [Nitrososphaerota archaeon]MDE0266074.1 class I SAM-dependent methyltransferase [Nitrososphaerota archaeon]MDE0525653.1 class I SAM-dependent methyltransferase [Nitrososphaerota archaeon]
MARGKDGGSGDIAQCWDREYEAGRYEAEPPVPFVSAIIGELRRRGWTDGRGVYVGCGNGRNYIPLAAACDGLRGIDVSKAGIRSLLRKHPEHAGRVSCADFLDGRHDAEGEVDYLVSIQTFQHGDERTAGKYLERAAAVLRPGGLLFLRVNSAGTDVYHPHETMERNDYGGFTVIYSAGPKKGLRVHFFARRELELGLRRAGLDLLGAPVERTERRRLPKTGEWRQWELTAVRRAR